MTTRDRLPNRRTHEVITFVHAGFAYTAGVGRFGDGRLAEVFLTADAKGGSIVESWARDAAVLASIALQCGAEPEVIRGALTRDHTGEAAGPVGKLLDLLAGKPAP
jgi:ribonucleoside-diphosphate reductase alpha chain